MPILGPNAIHCTPIYHLQNTLRQQLEAKLKEFREKLDREVSTPLFISHAPQTFDILFLFINK